MTERRIGIVLNPGSGRDRTEDPEKELAGLVADMGLDAQIYCMDKRNGADVQVAAARRDGCDVIVAAGGDGTICGVAAELTGADETLGIIPLGTFNYFARSLDIPADMEGALSIVAQGRVQAVNTGTINDRLFLNNTSIGRYPEILETREGIYRRWGRSRIAAYWSVVKTLMTLRRPLYLTIDADGTQHRLRTPLVFVLNNAFQLEQQGLEGADALSEGKLVMFLSPDAGRFGLIRQALMLLMGRAVEQRDFIRLTARRFDIESRRRRHTVALDGERVHLARPLQIRAHAKALHVIVPESYERDVR